MIKALSEDEFWQIGDKALAAGKHNVEEVTHQIWLQLKDEHRRYISRYYKRLQVLVSNLAQWKTWGAYKAMIKPHGFEAFDCFCVWVVLHGREFYEEMLANPDDLANRPWLQGVCYNSGLALVLNVLLGIDTWGRWLEYRLINPHDVPHKLPGTPISEQEIPMRYPQLWERSRKPKARKSASLSSVRGKLTEEHFWKIIEVAGDGDGASSDDLVAVLTQLTKSQIRAFSEMFTKNSIATYRWDVWGVVYLLLGGCGDDEFEYFRAWLVAQGKGVYDSVLADPQALASMDNAGQSITDESLLYAPSLAYEEVAGEELPPPRVKHPDTPVGTEWAEEDLPDLFPGIGD
jgi:hypothetical protein